MTDSPNPDWDEYMKEGQQAAVNASFERREPARQQLLQEQVLKPFDGCQFPAFFRRTSIKYTKYGDMQITLTVPRKHVELAEKLKDADGTPLYCDVQRWTLNGRGPAPSSDNRGEGSGADTAGSNRGAA